MTFSKQIFSLFFLFFIFPLRHASNPTNCSSLYSKPLRCGPLEVPIRFPFCEHPWFNLRCNDLNKTILELPMSGTFLVKDIDYINQQISINDPENCWAKRLLTFNISVSPFSYHFDTKIYTFLACPNEAVSPLWYVSIPCLSNSTSTFFATSNSPLEETMLHSCKIVKRVLVPAISPFGEREFSSYIENQSLSLEWNSPNCKDCEIDNLRCGFKNKTSLEVKCLVDKKKRHISNGSIGAIIGLVVFFAILISSFFCSTYHDEASHNPRLPIAAIETPITTLAQGTTGLDQSKIKMELGESKRLPGTNRIVCPSCVTESTSKETVRITHVYCSIHAWLP